MGKSLAVEYRPKTIDEVIGQESAVKILTNIFKKQKPPAAILITGDTGCGKTTLMRIIARTLNCAEGTGCGKCTSCKIMDDGYDSHPDYKEVNAATQRGIEDARNLEQIAVLRPRFKFRIIGMDECHQLTPQAMESLLKVLEEPPPGTLWILATTDPQKLKQTMKDRAVNIRLVPVPVDQLASRLKCIARKVGFKNLPDSLYNKIAEYSAGYVRNAITSLEAILNQLGDTEKLTDKKIDKMLAEIFESDESYELNVNAMRLLALMYEGRVAQIFEVLADVKDYSLIANRLSYMNGYVIARILQMSGAKTKFPYFATQENRTLWGAIEEMCKDKAKRSLVLSNAFKAEHRVMQFREAMFSSSHPDKLALAFTALTDEPRMFKKIK